MARAPVLSASPFSGSYDVGSPAILANFVKLLLPLLLPLLFFFVFPFASLFVAASCFTSSLLLLSFEFSLFVTMVDRVEPLRGLFPNYRARSFPLLPQPVVSSLSCPVPP